MAESQVPYPYAPDELNAIRAALTIPRLAKYLEASSFDHVRAMDLYLWNARLAKALQYPIHIAEVTVRNTVSAHLQTLANIVRVPDWPLSDPFVLSTLGPDSVTSISKAKERLSREGKDVTSDRIIAKLPFEFWFSALGAAHDVHWQTAIRSYFINMEAHESRRDIYRMTGEVLWLRNRVAHHEPIFHLQDILQRHLGIFDLIQKRCSDTAKWAKSHSTFLKVWHDKPKLDRSPNGREIMATAQDVILANSDTSLADALKTFIGKRRDHLVTLGADGRYVLIVSDDVTRWISEKVEEGLIDVATPILSDVINSGLRTNVEFVSRKTTSKAALEIFFKTGARESEKAQALLITENGLATEGPFKVVFRPDFREG